MKRKKYIIVDGRKFFIFMTSILILLSFLFSLAIRYPKAYGSIENHISRDYYVVSGDNLWNIALRNIPKGYDVREAVYDIKILNNMTTSKILENTTIKIPIY